jgi:hypothetical protein
MGAFGAPTPYPLDIFLIQEGGPDGPGGPKPILRGKFRSTLPLNPGPGVEQSPAASGQTLPMPHFHIARGCLTAAAVQRLHCLLN